MTPFNTNFLHSFRISDEITSPQLRGTRTVLVELEELKRCARDTFAKGLPGEQAPHHVSKRLGSILAEAILEDDLEAIAAAGLFWLNRSTWSDSILPGLWDTLREQGRVDLFRPAILLLHTMCVHRAAAAPNALPHATAEQQQQHFSALCAEAEADPDGATAAMDPIIQWRKMIEHSAKLMGDGNRTPSDLGTRLSALLDVVETIPNTRAWRAPILLAGLNLGRHRDLAGTRWWHGLLPVMDDLTPQEAGLVLRRMADVCVMETSIGSVEVSGSPDIQRLARTLREHYVGVSSDTWLSEDPSIQVYSSGLNRIGWSGIRLQMAGNPHVFAANNVDLERTRLPQTAMTYDLMLTWLGPDRVDPPAQALRDVLGRLLTQPEVARLPLLALRSALDRWTLVDATNAVGEADRNDPDKSGVPRAESTDSHNDRDQSRAARRARL